MNLGVFLTTHLEKPRAYGAWDCCTFPAAWAMACGHADPMREWRGAYDDEPGARALIDAAGGLAALFARGMASAGVSVANDWQQGDIAVLDVLGHEAGAVFTGQRWALVTERGLGFVSVEPPCVAAIWRP